MRSKIFFVINPTTKTNTKKRRIFRTTISGLAASASPCPLIPVRTERSTIPRISSMIAALKRVVPVFVLSLPSSFSVSTVIPTEVAAKIIPTKQALRMLIKSTVRSKKKK